ncbi:MAG: GldG family protein [Clostridiales bacterium]|nr:GldG family protein [Clostridiales bacterium]
MKKVENNKANNKNLVGDIKASFSGRKFRSGAYVTIISTIVVIMILVVNLLVSKLDLQYDLSSNKYYTLSDKTIDYVKNINENVTIYYLSETGSQNELVYRMVSNYNKISSKVKVVDKDPVLYPKFVSDYVEDVNVTQNSVLVVNDNTKRAKYISYNDMLEQEFDYNTLSSSTVGLDVEGQITSAIQYVTDPDLPIMYVVEGHNETALGNNFKISLEKQNITIEQLSTLTVDSIPEDCDILFINAPKNDFTDNEIAIIREYMEKGGNAIIALGYNGKNLTNLQSILDYYGVEQVEGIVFEGDSNYHLPNYPHYLVPEIQSHDYTKDIIKNRSYIMAAIPSGLSILEGTRSSLKVEPLLKTSDKAYSKVDINASTVEKTSGDIDGPFYIGLVASDTYNDITSNLVVFSSELFFDDSTFVSFGNGSLLNKIISQVTGKTTSLSIPTKSLKQNTIYLTQGQAILWGAIVVIIVPVLILGTGIVIAIKRRKK